MTKEIFGVYEGVTKDDVIDYLYSDVKFKKIMVTPESFSKVKDAIEEVGMNLYQDFFLLFDECERIIQDVSYRKTITLPMDDFFLFKGKAFISATPLPPSDPRFKKKRFTELHVVPDFDNTIDLELMPTNNILLSLKHYFSHHKNDHYFIFLNSTDTIASVIKTLNIRTESHVFCARESVVKFRAINLNIANQHFENKLIKKYNFFSSRFNSAVDLKVAFKPNILIISDLTRALHSKVDPLTQVVQIIGRLRNGYNNVTHITNLKENLVSKTEEQIINYLEGCESAYNTIKALRQAATTEGARNTLDQCLELVEYAQFVNPDGSKNYYMFDNEIHSNRVNGYYHNAETLKLAYEQTNRFKIKFKPQEYLLDDIHNNKLEAGLSNIALYRKIAETLLKIEDADNALNMNAFIVRAQLQKMFPDICDAFRKLKYEGMAELNFSPGKIRDAVYKITTDKEKKHFEFLQLLNIAFNIDKVYTT
ncbi:hypothetical protein EON78_03630, partial [bacterium]